MKKFFGTLAIACLAGSAFAADYPMSGQDTVYNAGATPHLALVNKNGTSLSLEDGHAYRLRFSNASKSFHIMAGDGKTNEFKVSGGFPGGNLKAFTLDGSKFGNPHIKLVKGQGGETLEVSEPYTKTESCTYACGEDYICRDVPEQICRTRTQQICRDVPEEVCRTDQNGNRVCQTIDRRVCRDEEIRECDTVYRRVCGYETRYCSGIETWKVQRTTTGEVLRMKVLDALSNAQLGEFRGELSSNSSIRKLELLDTTCR